ncbi:HDIG domain-containing protein [Deinococcus metallilatus]|uniref:HDIG domain-containing protein n=2 Tax=Deinococcus TaxID=1298 RepID=A0AAJ5K0I5_9DEIO|nr:HD domain-containing protein [Deinococcus metallilatus]MBB5294806.1 putative nucleotidyltransferase with HDIG domain [Deinococcus metallilatus]QBY09473.1 HDIG domain-containing protein [Deinococcus metallilatus]RXJ09478.1 HDIG domain-containing protein [Deinococcus metallilatus]TLK29000.1 HDIG domain-containing protein [Deinococcus metallilatus]GMA16732.1 phosphohydrolase [Deinococcus metallilatus]
MRPLTPSARLARKGRGYLGKVRRLTRSLSARLARPDDAWATARLTPAEARVYLGMDARDREHACRVTRHLLREHPHAAPEVVAAALLHDCGKSIRPYRVAERVLVGLVPNRLSRLLPFGPLSVRAYHPELGAELLARAGARPRVARLVARHHHPGGDPDAALLHHYDDLE